MKYKDIEKDFNKEKKQIIKDSFKSGKFLTFEKWESAVKRWERDFWLKKMLEVIDEMIGEEKPKIKLNLEEKNPIDKQLKYAFNEGYNQKIQELQKIMDTAEELVNKLRGKI